MPLEHQIIKTTRHLITERVSKPMPEEMIPQGFPKDPIGVAEYLIKAYLYVSGFDFKRKTLVNLASFAVYRPDRSRTIVFDRGTEPADRVAHILHHLGHIHLEPLPYRYVLVRPEQRDRSKTPDHLPVEEAADEWAMAFAQQLLSNAHPDNLLAEGLRIGSERIVYLGKP
jgi:hypothetical protein